MPLYNIATRIGPRPIEAKVAWLLVGTKRHKFLIHNGGLTDFRSGRRFGDINAIKIERMCVLGHAHRTPDRRAAQLLVNRTVARLGPEAVLERMAQEPAINT